jgi:protein SCO1/2
LNSSETQPAKKPGHGVEWVVWGALAVTIAVIAVAFIRTRIEEGTLRAPLTNLGRVPDFTLTNQHGQPLSLSNLLGQVWVADVIFTRCPMSCERMTQRMHALEKQVSDRAPVKFVSITTDPGYDSPAVLQKYALRHEADQSRWHFLTGIKSNVYQLSVAGLKFAVLDNTNMVVPDDLFLHSTHFTVVDKRGNIRGVFEGTEDEDRRQLLLAVKKLAKEKN